MKENQRETLMWFVFICQRERWWFRQGEGLAQGQEPGSSQDFPPFHWQSPAFRERGSAAETAEDASAPPCLTCLPSMFGSGE